MLHMFIHTGNSLYYRAIKPVVRVENVMPYMSSRSCSREILPRYVVCNWSIQHFVKHRKVSPSK